MNPGQGQFDIMKKSRGICMNPGQGQFEIMKKSRGICMNPGQGRFDIMKKSRGICMNPGQGQFDTGVCEIRYHFKNSFVLDLQTLPPQSQSWYACVSLGVRGDGTFFHSASRM